jgi:hypothetical protein
MTVLRTVQFDGQFRVGAVEIQDAIAYRVLPAEFETGKPSSSQRPPERLFVVRLMAAQFAGDLFEAHAAMMFAIAEISSPPAAYLRLPLLAQRGEGRGEELLAWESHSHFFEFFDKPPTA